MPNEETKDTGMKDKRASFWCCNPAGFREMFESNCDCFSGQGDPTDFSDMKMGMVKKMMETWCGSKVDETLADDKSQENE